MITAASPSCAAPALPLAVGLAAIGRSAPSRGIVAAQPAGANRPHPAGTSQPHPDFNFRAGEHACAACHTDPHAGQFAPVTECARCHEAAAWRIPRFDHDKTRFHLEGAHRRVACSACHRAEKVAGKSVVRYRPLDTACRSCHTQPVGTLGK